MMLIGVILCAYHGSFGNYHRGCEVRYPAQNGPPAASPRSDGSLLCVSGAYLALRQALREREQDGLRLTGVRAERGTQTPTRPADVHLLEGECLSLRVRQESERSRTGPATRRKIDIFTSESWARVSEASSRCACLFFSRCFGVLTGLSVRQVPRECRRVLSLIHERCDNCTRAAWATFERESGRVW